MVDVVTVYGCVGEEHMVKRDDDGTAKISRNEYYRIQKIWSVFHDHIVPTYHVSSGAVGSSLSTFNNERSNNEQHMDKNIKKMMAVADISCDIEGVLNFDQIIIHRTTFFLYNPKMMKRLNH